MLILSSLAMLGGIFHQLPTKPDELEGATVTFWAKIKAEAAVSSWVLLWKKGALEIGILYISWQKVFSHSRFS